jgi:hypothetical protein
MAKKAAPPASIVKVFKRFISTEVKDINDKERSFAHVVTSKTIDRDDEVVLPKGARLDTYRENPMVFFNHRSMEPPIAQNLELSIDDNERMWALSKFAGLDQLHEKAEMLYRLYRDRFMRAWSIGFRVLTDSREPLVPGQRGRSILEWEMLEYSGVGIPANPDAVMRMCKAYGLPDGATERDLEQAVLGAQKYWDLALPILEGKSDDPPAEPETPPTEPKSETPPAIKPIVMQVEVRGLDELREQMEALVKLQEQLMPAIDLDTVEAKSFMGFQEHGFTSPAAGTTAPMHVHDYGLYVERPMSVMGTEVRFSGGCAYDIADHRHRITLESLQRGETEASDGHVHKLMSVEQVRAALLVTSKTASPPEPPPPVVPPAAPEASLEEKDFDALRALALEVVSNGARK